MSGDRDGSDREDRRSRDETTQRGSSGGERRESQRSQSGRGREGEGNRRREGGARGGGRQGRGGGRGRRGGYGGGGGMLDSDHVTFSVGAFLAVGLGTALGFFLFFTLLPGRAGSGLGTNFLAGGTALSLVIGLFTAPLVGLVAGVATGIRIEDSYDAASRAAVSAGVGSIAGYFIQFIVLLLFTLVLAGGGGGGGGGGAIGAIIAPVLGLSVGVGITGAMAGYFAARF